MSLKIKADRHVNSLNALLLLLPILIAAMISSGCGSTSSNDVPLTPAEWTQRYTLGSNAGGMLEFYGNLYNLSIVSKDTNANLAEYNAGYIQGRLAGYAIRANRDNDLHAMPMQRGKSIDELEHYITLTQDIANANLTYTLNWINNCSDPSIRQKMLRFFYRMMGIRQGASGLDVQQLEFNGEEIFEPGFFSPEDLIIGYESPHVTFLDIYFQNANHDIDTILDSLIGYVPDPSEDHCSAFIMKLENDMIIAHTAMNTYTNSIPFHVSLMINDNYISMQSFSPGIIYSQSDFGYNGHGIMFDETTVAQLSGFPHPRIESIWTFLQAAMAEFYSTSIDDYYNYISQDNSGTYINGYQVADINRNQFGLIEIDETTFYYYQPDGSGGYNLTCKPDCSNREYDHKMITDRYVVGFNYPVASAARESLNFPPAPEPYASFPRYYQFQDRINTVTDIESAKALITYHDDAYPVSIAARSDKRAVNPKPAGSTVTKVVSASMVKHYLSKKGSLEDNFFWGRTDPTWMKFGPPLHNGEPFVWSTSPWSDWRHELMPDVMYGDWYLYFSHIK